MQLSVISIDQIVLIAGSGQCVDAGRGRECGVEGRDERDVSPAYGGSLEDTLVAARELGASASRHIISDGDRAMDSAIDMAYDGNTLDQLCQFHLRREYPAT